MSVLRGKLVHVVQFIIMMAGFWITAGVVFSINYFNYQRLDHTEARVVFDFYTDYGGVKKSEVKMLYKIEGVTYYFSTENNFFDRKYHSWDIVPMVYKPTDPQTAWIDSLMGYWYRGPQMIVTGLVGFIWFGLYYLYLNWKGQKEAM